VLRWLSGVLAREAGLREKKEEGKETSFDERKEEE
jgi:hypothetical protein